MGSPALNFAGCDACRGSTTMVGVECGGCAHHFHIGRQLLGEKEAIHCPRCETTETARDIGGEPTKAVDEMSEMEIIDAVCTDVEPAVAKAVRHVAKTRRSRDPNFWANVMLREMWFIDHGSYDGWDASCRAGGIDPLQFAAVPT